MSVSHLLGNAGVAESWTDLIVNSINTDNLTVDDLTVNGDATFANGHFAQFNGIIAYQQNLITGDGTNKTAANGVVLIPLDLSAGGIPQLDLTAGTNHELKIIYVRNAGGSNTATILATDLSPAESLVLEDAGNYVQLIYDLSIAKWVTIAYRGSGRVNVIAGGMLPNVSINSTWEINGKIAKVCLPTWEYQDVVGGLTGGITFTFPSFLNPNPGIVLSGLGGSMVPFINNSVSITNNAIGAFYVGVGGTFWALSLVPSAAIGPLTANHYVGMEHGANIIYPLY